MRCPHCGSYGGGVINRDWDNTHGCRYGRDCVRETWKCWEGCNRTWTQWTEEG